MKREKRETVQLNFGLLAVIVTCAIFWGIALWRMFGQ